MVDLTGGEPLRVGGRVLGRNEIAVVDLAGDERHGGQWRAVKETVDLQD